MGVKFEILHKGQVVETRELGDGSYRIGRSDDVDIHLKSRGVSKSHALLVIKGEKAAIVDTGSANGVFINGVLVKKERFRVGDQIAIAEYVIRYAKDHVSQSEIRSSQGEVSPPEMGNLAPNVEFQVPQEEEEQEVFQSVEEMSAQERFLYLMDEKVLGPLYSLMQHFDWRVLLSLILIGAFVMSVLASVVPIFRWGKRIATNESLNRAHTILSQMVRENYRILTKTNDFTRLTVEAGEAERGIIRAMIVDPKKKSIYAPATLFNKTATDIYFILAINQIVSGEEEIVSVEKRDEIYVVAQPIFLFSEEENSRVLRAIVLAEFQVPEGVYATLEPLVAAGLISILLALIAYFLIMKMITLPIIRMQEQLDAAMKGEEVSVECGSKFPELEGLARNINFSVSRWQQAEAAGGDGIDFKDMELEDKNYMIAVEGFDQGTSDGLLLLDREKKVRFVGKALEELINMRTEYAMGQNISDACKDPSFAGTSVEVSDRVIKNFGETQFAELEINGIHRNITAIGHKNSNGEVDFVLITVKLTE